MKAFADNPVWAVAFVAVIFFSAITITEINKDPRVEAMRACAGVFASEATSVACARAIYGEQE